jgi:hypothetical protein
MAIKQLDKSFSPSKKEIRYLGKTFGDYRQNLIDFAKVYFPESYNDFNEASPGMMFIEMASYVGDVLGYYIDANFRENLLSHASEQSNIISIAQAMGYQPKPATAATTEIDLFQVVPAKGSSDNYIPDERYYLRLSPNAVFGSESFGSVNFRTIDEVNFAEPMDREISVYSVDNFNRPTFYLIRKKVKVIAGTIKTFQTTFASPQRFSRVVIPDDNVLDVISVTDSSGNTWSQVDFLAQDLIFRSETNTAASDRDDDFSVPPTYLLKISRTPRRFVVRYNEKFECELLFGSGILEDSDSSINLEPKKIANSEYQTNLASTSLDPSDFLSSRSYGLSPTGQLTITYATGGGLESNVPTNSITKIVTANPLNDTSFMSPSELQVWNTVKQSLAVNNSDPAVGGRGQDTVEEIRQNALAFFNAQNRLVTVEDYIARSYAMPPKYGGIAKIFVGKDAQINDILRSSTQQAPIDGMFVQNEPGPGVINLYVLGYNSDKKLVSLNTDTKQNLKTYLDQYRMLTDDVRILDAFVVNVGVKFKIVVFQGFNMNEVLARCIDTVKQFFNIENWQINQPIVINNLYLEIASVEGVQSVVNVELFNRYSFQDGGEYNEFIYDLSAATNNGIVYPSLDPCIFEIRFPERDILGSAVQ